MIPYNIFYIDKESYNRLSETLLYYAQNMCLNNGVILKLRTIAHNIDVEKIV